MAERMSIGQVAAKTGLTPDTIRYYERVALLPKPSRTPAGYRQYAEGVVNRLALIRNAQRFGFSLRQIAAFLRVREAGGAPCGDVRRAAQRLLDAVDQQIAELIATRKQMHQTLREWDGRLSATRAGQPAYLLEALNGTGSLDPARRRRLKRTALRSA